jgi:hypothetical protein
MKRLKFKKPFNGFGNVLNLIPEGYRVNGIDAFEMTDGNETYRVTWSDGKGHILEASDKTMVSESLGRLKELMKYKSETTLGTATGKERLAENEILTKSLMTENNQGIGQDKNGKMAPMNMGDAIGNFLNNPKHKSPEENTPKKGDYNNGEGYEKESRAQKYGIHGESEDSGEDKLKTDIDEPGKEGGAVELSDEVKTALEQLLIAKLGEIKDDDIHDFTEKRGLNTHNVEAYIYKLAGEALKAKAIKQGDSDKNEDMTEEKAKVNIYANKDKHKELAKMVSSKEKVTTKK